MAVDLKYGKVTVEKEPGNPLGEDEVVIVFRSADRTLPEVMAQAVRIATENGCDEQHTSKLGEARQAIQDWQALHPELVKRPDS